MQGINWPEVRKAALLLAIGFLSLVIITALGASGCKEYGRYQKRADAKNRTAVVKQEIKTADQQALVVKAQIAATIARAEQRKQEAIGIRAAQDEISATLTPEYLQHEAIGALSESGAATVYIPSGEQGIPLVREVTAAK